MMLESLNLPFKKNITCKGGYKGLTNHGNCMYIACMDMQLPKYYFGNFYLIGN